MAIIAHAILAILLASAMAATLVGRRASNRLLDGDLMPKNAIKHPDVIGVPIVDPEFWREVNLVTVRGRAYSPGVGALVREAMRKKWFGQNAIAARSAKEKYRHGGHAPEHPSII